MTGKNGIISWTNKNQAWESIATGSYIHWIYVWEKWLRENPDSEKFLREKHPREKVVRENTCRIKKIISSLLLNFFTKQIKQSCGLVSVCGRVGANFTLLWKLVHLTVWIMNHFEVVLFLHKKFTSDNLLLVFFFT